MTNWFPTLNEALAAENLVDHWPVGVNIGYSESVSLSSKGLWIVVNRDEHGMYERPIRYDTRVEDGRIIRNKFS